MQTVRAVPTRDYLAADRVGTAWFDSSLFAVSTVATPLPTLRSYLFNHLRAKPRRPWGMKITMAMKMMPTGMR
jgi:hypothetical protein